MWVWGRSKKEMDFFINLSNHDRKRFVEAQGVPVTHCLVHVFFPIVEHVRYGAMSGWALLIIERHLAMMTIKSQYLLFDLVHN